MADPLFHRWAIRRLVKEGATESDVNAYMKYHKLTDDMLNADASLQGRAKRELGLKDYAYRGQVVPLGRTEEGKIEPAIPQFAVGMAESAMLPRHAMEGGSYTSRDALNATVDYALPSTMSRQPGRAGQRPSPRDLRSLAKPQQELAAKGQKFYQTIDNSGAVVDPNKVMDFLIDSHGTLMKNNFRPRLHPKTEAIIKEMESTWDQFSAGVPVTELQNMRKMITDELATKLKPADRRLLNILQRQTDDLIAGIEPKDLIGGRAADFGEALKGGNAYWSAAMKTKRLDLATARAQRSPSGFTKGLQGEFRKILNNENLARGFSAGEKAVMEDVIKSGLTKTTLEKLGKFGFSRNVLGGLAGSAAGSTVGGMLGGGYGAAIGAIVPPSIAAGAQKMADMASRRQLDTIKGMASTGWKRPRGLFDGFAGTMPPLLPIGPQPEDEGLTDEQILRGLLLAPGVS